MLCTIDLDSAAERAVHLDVRYQKAQDARPAEYALELPNILGFCLAHPAEMMFDWRWETTQHCVYTSACTQQENM